MQKTIQVALVIPCYNEANNIKALFNSIKNTKIYGVKLTPVFINDCSTDHTITVIKSLSCEYLDLSVNLGIGGAVQCGYKYAFQNNFDIAIQVDGDGQHDPKELHKIITPIVQNKADVVIGSRFITKEGFQSSFMRRLGINYFKWLNKHLVGVKITDSTSGFRALNRKALELVNDHYPDDYPEPEAIVLFKMNNLKIKEVPVLMKERTNGVSSINAIKSVYYMLKVTLGILFMFLKLKQPKYVL